ncbi:hypothetical protein [Roseivivax jejudonensis]|uniref:hypothetical protein n=1 Tax=Roseivivax jejudonensis TaxID=1529041 RepID=UPI00117B0294|nr:hypothetical protein [Roseivivax jejudonensis]
MAEPVSINIDGESCPVICARCKEPIFFIGEVDTEVGEVGCTACENVSPVKEAAREALDFAKAEAQLRLNQTLKDEARKSKFMTFSGQLSHNRTYRFLVDF